MNNLKKPNAHQYIFAVCEYSRNPMSVGIRFMKWGMIDENNSKSIRLYRLPQWNGMHKAVGKKVDARIYNGI